jgi:protein-tyrosine phosphatase
VHLKELGFGHVIDLNADSEERRKASEAGIVYHPIKVTDPRPSEEELLAKFPEVVKIIVDACRRGEKIFMHCTAAKGRSPTFAMAYLIHEGYPAEEAIELVKKKHKKAWAPGEAVSIFKNALQEYSYLIGRQKELVSQFEKAYQKSNPSLSSELIREVTEKFRELVESFDDEELSNAWSSLGRLFLTIHRYQAKSQDV